jgi:hypothetical protein
MADAAAASDIVVHIEDEDNATRVDPATGTIEIDQPDGSVVVQLDAKRQSKPDGDEGDKFYANLAIDIPGIRLGQIANDLIDAIQADDRSRGQYLQIRARGLDLLGLKLEEPKSSVGDSGSSIDGMSSVTNPLLLEAVLKGWANARAELLPAEGPVKISDEGDETAAEDEQAETLEKDFNYYLTKTATEYVPDTSHMLLWGTYFGGSGFKKVYRCPMRRRPVSESIDAKDLIVSDTTKDLKACGRVTHVITMRPSVMKRMKLLGAYRDATLTQPTPQPNVVDAKIAGIQGTQPTRDRPEDEPFTLYETQCEIDLEEGFDHPSMSGSQFKDAGIPLPYLVTIDKDSREILQLRRDWEEGDEECERDRMYVKYPYVPGPGFYGTGMLNILGNCSAAMTAAWREALDCGMFANFPGGLITKLGSRQNTSNFRLGPGEFVPVETNNLPIDKVAMPLPYKDVTSGLLKLIELITGQAKELGGSAEIPAGEGLQNIPVGTMLAQIEQATKVMAAAHKDMHQAQAEEIDLFTKLFRRHPEDFWRSNKRCAPNTWDEQKLLAALDNCKLVPRSDPNTPSHLHRIMKAVAWANLIVIPAFAPFLNAKEILLRIVRAMREDPAGVVVDPPPSQPQGDPAAMATANAKVLDAQTKAQKLQIDAAKVGNDAQIKAGELAAETGIEQLRLKREEIIHRGDAAQQAQDTALDVRKQALAENQHSLEQAKVGHEASMGMREHSLDQARHGLDVEKARHDVRMDLTPESPKPQKP